MLRIESIRLPTLPYNLYGPPYNFMGRLLLWAMGRPPGPKDLPIRLKIRRSIRRRHNIRRPLKRSPWMNSHLIGIHRMIIA